MAVGSEESFANFRRMSCLSSFVVQQFPNIDLQQLKVIVFRSPPPPPSIFNSLITTHTKAPHYPIHTHPHPPLLPLSLFPSAVFTTEGCLTCLHTLAGLFLPFSIYTCFFFQIFLFLHGPLSQERAFSRASCLWFSLSLCLISQLCLYSSR